MRHRWIRGAVLCLSLLLAAEAQASTGDIGAIIEGFVSSHFPDASSHLWVINSTQWDGDEMVVDVNTIVVEKRQPEPIENRFLLLIVGGKLTAAQNVPLNADTDCGPEQT